MVIVLSVGEAEYRARHGSSIIDRGRWHDMRAGRVSLSQFSDTVGAIYDCALDPEAWPDALARIATLCESCNSTMFLGPARKEQSLRIVTHGLDPAYLRLYLGKYAAMNPLFAAGFYFGVGEPHTLAMLVDREEFEESRFYREWCAPQELGDLIGFIALRSERGGGAFSVMRRLADRRYDAEDLELVRILSPHICRAVAISNVLEARSVTLGLLETTLDGLSTAVFLTRRDGRILYMNTAAEHVLRTRTALRSVGSVLSASDAAADRILKSAISGPPPSLSVQPMTADHGIALPAQGEDGGLLATVLPLDQGRRTPDDPVYSAAVAVFVQDPERAAPLPAAALARLYGLTPGELRVALAMAPGLGPQEAADMLGIGLNTVKTHLQRLFDKTGTTRQSELMVLLARAMSPVRLETG